ncbi:hypothetical protein J1N35_022371 [Gossypium stocksii]|uniref:Uncharacterized protein n=1 Tax=Gossypium stocksii TaxID=47602 RepID=A0A9D3VG02_9ROSI|nr:hypothetical protein J1N35_022371 [Gossypium stocksii]
MHEDTRLQIRLTEKSSTFRELYCDKDYLPKPRCTKYGGRLCGILGFRKVQNQGTYLGIPFFHERITNSFLRSSDQSMGLKKVSPKPSLVVSAHSFRDLSLRFNPSFRITSSGQWGMEIVFDVGNNWKLGLRSHANLDIDCLFRDLLQKKARGIWIFSRFGCQVILLGTL